MNYRTKCASYYQVAGTCNCFANKGVTVNPVLPMYPQPTIVPWGVPWNPTSPTIIWGNAAAGAPQIAPPITVNFTAGAAACAPQFTGYIKQFIA